MGTEKRLDKLGKFLICHAQAQGMRYFSHGKSYPENNPIVKREASAHLTAAIG